MKCPLSGLPCYQQKCIHVTEVGPDYKAQESKDMCLNCGPAYISEASQGAIDPPVALPATQPLTLFDLMNTLIKDKNLDAGSIHMHAPTLPTCPSCGYTFEDIKAVGRVGCGACYEFFKKDLGVLIEKCQQGASKHTGKVPQTKTAKTLAELEADLKLAVESENYSLAAQLRDEIKKLKSQSSQT